MTPELAAKLRALVDRALRQEGYPPRASAAERALLVDATDSLFAYYLAENGDVYELDLDRPFARLERADDPARIRETYAAAARDFPELAGLDPGARAAQAHGRRDPDPREQQWPLDTGSADPEPELQVEVVSDENEELERAAHAHGQGDYQACVERAMRIARSASSPGAHGAAGVLACDAREQLDQPVDCELLAASASACETDYPYYAAVGYSMLGRLGVGDLRAHLEHAVELFDRAGSMLGGPGTLRRLAGLAGDRAAAIAYLDRGIARLKQFPLGGANVRRLERELKDMKAKLAEEKQRKKTRGR